MTPTLTMAVYAVGLISSKLIALILQPFVTQWLGPEQFGRLDVLVALGSLLTLIMSFGISDAIYRFAHEQQNQDDIFRNALGLLLTIAGGLTIVAQLAVPWLQQVLPGEPPLFALHCLLTTLFLNTLSCVPLAILRIRNQAKIFVAAQVVFALIQGLGILLLAPHYGVDGVMAAGLVAQIVQVIVLAKHFPSPKLGHIRLFFRYGRAITLSGVLSFIVIGAERWAIADTLGLSLLAPYAVAIQWAIAASLLLEPFGLWWFPKRFGLVDTAEDRQQAAVISIVGCQLSCLVTAGIIVVGSRFLLWWLPDDFHASSEMLPLLGIMVMFKHASTLLNIGCYHQKDGKSVVLIGVFGACCALGILLFILPEYGLFAFIGAGIGLQLLRLGLFYYYSQHYLHLPYPLGRLAASYGLIMVLLTAHYQLSPAYEVICTLLLIGQVSWPWAQRKLIQCRQKKLDNSLRVGRAR
ncbi:lipopolysaccharide biosynthesis protein [Photobacterium lutimaris]|uniref:Polysaccharide biosynthesis family protein n=1 Tax=Photobacterium lutimaris TaxID=388278 RepID=A0A2T3IX98_9GAMM|nr:lipopolysaccharide biosynthesis protein [Photobacterium lutimaris]PSU33111.1 polysaccharide biosynthesis family protein [Photobacterium lutimaris]TDR70187.1 O-antigen/teichoic acid export membrane protein [Photobacterium lutimaris]